MELMNLEMEVTNILETKAYKITKQLKVLLIKNWLGQLVRSAAYKTF